MDLVKGICSNESTSRSQSGPSLWSNIGMVSRGRALLPDDVDALELPRLGCAVVAAIVDELPASVCPAKL